MYHINKQLEQKGIKKDINLYFVTFNNISQVIRKCSQKENTNNNKRIMYKKHVHSTCLLEQIIMLMAQWIIS